MTTNSAGCGIVAYFKGSMELSVINDKLFLHGGKIVDRSGMHILLPHTSYAVMDSIGLDRFENHTKYYFYIASAGAIDKSVILHDQNITEDILFVLTSSEQYENAVKIGEIEIDYEQANIDKRENIGIPANSFLPSKNEIDTRFIHVAYVAPDRYMQKAQKKISLSLQNLARTMHLRSAGTMDDNIAQTIISLALSIALNMELKRYLPYEIYKSLKLLIDIFAWSDKRIWSNQEIELIEKLEDIFGTAGKSYRATPFHINMEEKGWIIHEVLHLIDELSFIQNSTIRHHKENNNLFGTAENIAEVKENNIFVDDPYKDSIVSFDGTDQQETKDHSTILLSGITKNEPYIQVGRGQQSGNDIIIGENDKTVSRVHLRITKHKKHGFFIEDLSSMGTYVDGELIGKNKKRFVSLKNKIKLGKKSCYLDLSDPKIQML